MQGKIGFNIEEVRWFAGGPPVNTISLPVPDPSRPWGNQNCSTYKGFVLDTILNQPSRFRVQVYHVSLQVA